MRQRGFVEMFGGGIDTHVKITTDATGAYTYTLAAYQQFVEIDTTLGIMTLYLPPVAEAEGRLYSITEITGANDITIAEHSSGESHDFTAPGTLSDADDRVLLYSDGKRWWTIVDKSS